MTKTRTETDSLGDVQVPADAYWGAQTQRAIESFPIGQTRMPRGLLDALIEIKRAVARANAELGTLDEARADAIERAADELAAGKLGDALPLVVWQTGSATQSNMNVNEVLANRASEIMGGRRGDKAPVHPNDHVNLGQSSNDTVPTAMQMAAAKALALDVLPAARGLAATLSEKSRAWQDIVKLGRTHLMDATPMTLGQEASGWAASITLAIEAIALSLPALHELPLGGTAVGTGLNAHPQLGERAIALLAARATLPFRPTRNRFAALAGHEPLVVAHGALVALATAAAKLANDVRLLASGPRGGIGELRIPANEPGSSIMPGKVNPTQAEALAMVCARVLGNQTTLSHAATTGSFELNVMKPVIALCFLESATLLADAVASFDVRCAHGLEPDRERIAHHLSRSLMLVTALAPHLGYDTAAQIAKHAHESGQTLREAALALGVIDAETFDRLVRPEDMV